MDGNNRWSKKNKVSKLESYKYGAKKLIDITNFIFENYNINYVSAFALSKHNFKRGSVLIDIIKKILIDFSDPLKDKNNYKFRIIFKGNLKFLPKDLLKNLINLQSNNLNSKNKLIIYLNYSGKDDILNTLKKLSRYKSKNIKNFNENLSTFGVPDPDMLIRTGGFKRLSDFMLYQISFTELFFTNKLWPNLNKNDVKKYIEQFSKIDRKFGN